MPEINGINNQVNMGVGLGSSEKPLQVQIELHRDLDTDEFIAQAPGSFFMSERTMRAWTLNAASSTLGVSDIFNQRADLSSHAVCALLQVAKVFDRQQLSSERILDEVPFGLLLENCIIVPADEDGYQIATFNHPSLRIV